MTRVLLDTRPIYNCDGDPQVQSQRRKPELPLIPVTTNGKVMVRFISHPNRDLNQPYFEQWCQQIQQWYGAGLSIYFFMHCPIEDHSPGHARHFQTMLQQLNLPIPPLPWQAIAPTPEQLSLFQFWGLVEANSSPGLQSFNHHWFSNFQQQQAIANPISIFSKHRHTWEIPIPPFPEKKPNPQPPKTL